MLFAHLKRILRLDRLCLTGLSGARRVPVGRDSAKPEANGSAVDAERRRSTKSTGRLRRPGDFAPIKSIASVSRFA